MAGYACDGRRISRWLRPTPLRAGRAELQSRDGERLGTLRLRGTGGSGTIELAGAERSFAAARARGTAGLWRAARRLEGKRGTLEAGWIVLGDGSNRGATTKFMKSVSDFLVQPAPELDPSRPTVPLDHHRPRPPTMCRTSATHGVPRNRSRPPRPSPERSHAASRPARRPILP